MNDYYANCIKPIASDSLNERTPFDEYVVPIFKYFSAAYRTSSFQWCEKGLETNTLVALFHNESKGRMRLADGIGYAVEDRSEVLLIESTGEEDGDHGQDNTMKLHECSIRALTMEKGNLDLASLQTFKKRRFYTMLYTKDKLTLMSTSLVDTSNWSFTFVRDAIVPRTWNKRHAWLPVFELVLCLKQKLHQQQEVSLALFSEHNGWTKVNQGEAIADYK